VGRAHACSPSPTNNLGDKVQISTCLARGDCFYGQRRTVVGSLRWRF
jgi:iron complex outermembrane receptor protein